jgi:FixJ family two-component response regulator
LNAGAFPPEVALGQTEHDTIYIVDDDDAVRDSARALLESYDHVVEDYASGRDFLSAFDDLNAGCLLLDLNMPEMGGIEVLEALRDRGASIPVIVVTAQSDAALLDRARRAGAFALVKKPVDGNLLGVIEQAFARHQASAFGD